MIKLFACGVNEYRGEGNLPFCVNDSIEFCKAFKENLLIEQKDIYMATKDGNISNIEYCKALKAFCGDATEDDTLVVFHSGHGGVDDNEDSFLLMTNSLNEDTYVYTDQIISFLSYSKAKCKVVILDCCHSDVGEKFIPPINENVVVEKFYSTGITIFCACKKQEQSMSRDGKISVFTQFLCDALRDKHLIREDSLYFNDFQNLVTIYAMNYNRKHPGEEQTPVMRTSTIGTVTFPARFCKEKKKERVKGYLKTEKFDALDIDFDLKKGVGNQDRKFINVRLVMKSHLEERNIKEIISDVVNQIGKISLSVSTKRQALIYHHPVEIINIVIYNDYIDYEANIYMCHAIWTLHDDFKWHKKNKIKCIQNGYCSWDFNSQYDFLKKMRLEHTFTDNELILFWKKQIDIVIKKTSEFDKAYHAYKADDMTVDVLCGYAKKVYAELAKIYNECDDSCFPIPFSEYKEFCDKSLNLIADARSLIFVCAFHKKSDTEKHLKDCLELELVNYYQSLKKWNDIFATIKE